MQLLWPLLILLVGAAGGVASVMYGATLWDSAATTPGDDHAAYYVFTYAVPVGIAAACGSLLWRLKRR